MHCDPVDGIQWYLSDAAPARTGSCAPSSEADDETASLEAFYDAWLPLYMDDAPRPDSPALAPPILRPPAFDRQPRPSVAQLWQQPRRTRPVLGPPPAAQGGHPLSTIYSVWLPSSASTVASAPVATRPPSGTRATMSPHSPPSLHRGLSAPTDYAWPAWVGQAGRAQRKGAIHAAAKTSRKAELHKLIIEQPKRLAEREESSGRTPLACAVRKQRFKQAEMILSAMLAYGHVADNVVNYVGYDGRNALLLAMDASAHHIEALGLFDALLQAGANPLWPCPIIETPRFWERQQRATPKPIASEHAAEYAVRTGKSLWLNKLLRWDESRHRTGKTPSFCFDIGALRTQAAARNGAVQAEVGRVLWAAERRRFGQALGHAHRRRTQAIVPAPFGQG